MVKLCTAAQWMDVSDRCSQRGKTKQTALKSPFFLIHNFPACFYAVNLPTESNKLHLLTFSNVVLVAVMHDI